MSFVPVFDRFILQNYQNSCRIHLIQLNLVKTYTLNLLVLRVLKFDLISHRIQEFIHIHYFLYLDLLIQDNQKLQHQALQYEFIHTFRKFLLLFIKKLIEDVCYFKN